MFFVWGEFPAFLPFVRGSPAQEPEWWVHSAHNWPRTAQGGCPCHSSWHRSQPSEEILNPSLTSTRHCPVFWVWNIPVIITPFQLPASRPELHGQQMTHRDLKLGQSCLQLMVNYAYLNVNHQILPPTIITSHQIWSSQRPRPLHWSPARLRASHLRYRWLSCFVESRKSS